MKLADPIQVDGSAFIGWHYLPAEAQTRIKQSLSSLVGVPSAEWGREDVEPWRPDENLFALHTQVGSDQLIVLFRPEGDGIRLLHLVLQETIDRYFTPKNGA